jgi:hypothetical protein
LAWALKLFCVFFYLIMANINANDCPTHIANFTEEIEANLDWYNAFLSVPPSLFDRKSRSDLRKHKASSTTLHGYQTFSSAVICSVSIKSRGDNDFRQACSTAEAVFRFSIQGGAEIPHFCLQLDLKHPNDDAMSLSFRVIWTAWGERGFYSERARNDPDTDPDGAQLYSFSNCLHDVRLFECVLNRNVAVQCMGKENAAGYAVAW